MSETAPEPRIVTERGLDARVAAIAEPVIEDLGYRLVRVRVSGLNGCTVQIMAERPDGSMAVADCALISRNLSPALDVDDPVERAYHLEVSSPGVDRPLVRRSDFDLWTGHVAKIEMDVMVDGRRRFRGEIVQVDDTRVQLKLEDGPQEQPQEAWLPLTDINEAKLVLTDALLAVQRTQQDQ